MKTIQLCQLQPDQFREYEWRESVNRLSQYKFLAPYSNAYDTLGYLNYLGVAWEKHYSVVLNPTDIWYIILSELAIAVGKNPKDYANLFTTTPDKKQEIIVLTGDVESINPVAVIEALKDRVPSSVDDFLPKFSTDTEWSRLAMNVAFCDLVSPYYSYSTMLCGIPAIRIGGTREDWVRIQIKLVNLLSLFSGSLHEYLLRCQDRVTGIIINAFDGDGVEFFKKMVKLKQCGSGHQFEMTGWMIHFLNRKDFTSPVMVDGMPTQTSKMTWKNLETGRKFQMFAGIFYSTFENAGENVFLVPQYNAHKIELGVEKKKPTKKDVEDCIEGIVFASEPVVGQTKKIKGIWRIEEEQMQKFYAAITPKTCPDCGFDMSSEKWKNWKHKLCPNCSFAVVEGMKST